MGARNFGASVRSRTFANVRELEAGESRIGRCLLGPTLPVRRQPAPPVHTEMAPTRTVAKTASFRSSRVLAFPPSAAFPPPPLAAEHASPIARAIRKQCAALCAGKLRVAVRRGPGVTFRQLAERWVNRDLAKEYPGHVKVKRSVDADRLPLAKPYPVIGDIPIDAFALDHAEQAMASLGSQGAASGAAQGG